MKRTYKITWIALWSVILLAGTPASQAQPADNSRALVYRIQIRKEINRTSQLYLCHGLDEAQSLGADAVLLHLNTYGGLLDAADSMRTAILYSPIPVYVFIDNNAASAGALISLACRQIYMRKGASIGAATVVEETGNALPDKYQSYMRAMMRATAEAHGKDTMIVNGDTTFRWKRDPQIAEAMVDDRIVIPNLVDSGKTLTLTADEAMRWGYCDGIAESADEIITDHLGYRDYRLVSFQPSFMDDMKGFLMNPFLQSILILIIIGGIYFELQTPGVGFPLIAAVIAAILYFSPLYIEGLAQNWEILLFIAGLILIAIEIFVTPGFGFVGISGIAFVIVGFVLSLLDNVNFRFEGVSSDDTGRAFLTVFSGIIAGSLAVVWLSSRIGSPGMFRRVALTADLEDAVSSPVHRGLEGREGVAVTVLRPSGKVAVDGTLYDSISESGFMEQGTHVRITRCENAQVYVERISLHQDGERC
ncbi:MAG: nodulation protein NfeD [Tannerella sp.]|jgi:membrane-bound serine protease (ClpP class)|nr:nodulation protein NfeD [Tannerella sp.]